MVVEFLSSVAVADVPPLLAADGMVLIVSGRQDRPAALRLWIIDEFFDIDAVKFLFWQSAER